MFLIGFFDLRALKNNPYMILFFYFICILALLGLFFFAPVIRGVKGWYKIGPFSVDPIELTKIILIILLAKYFSMRHVEMYRVRHILLSGFYVLLPCILIFFQPDLGSVLILIILWVGILLISGIRLRHFLVLCLCAILILMSGWFFLLKDYQKDRIISFVVPQIEPLGISWSQNQSKIAIGSGGLTGKGLGQGSQTQYGFLPETKTDFIFAAIAEELGIVGIGALFFFFSVFIWRIMKTAVSFPANFSRLFALGLAILLTSQVFIHAGMNLGIMPIIGIPFPLVSYGGSNMVSLFVSLGILQAIKGH